MSLKGRKVFVRKNGSQQGGGLYKWTPFDNQKDKRDTPKELFFCTTPLGSKGNDLISTYSYVIILENGEAKRSAYVQCDYVL